MFFGGLAQDIHDSLFNRDLPKNRIRLLTNALDEIVGRILDLYYKAGFNFQELTNAPGGRSGFWQLSEA